MVIGWRGGRIEDEQLNYSVDVGDELKQNCKLCGRSSGKSGVSGNKG